MASVGTAIKERQDEARRPVNDIGRRLSGYAQRLHGDARAVVSMVQDAAELDGLNALSAAQQIGSEFGVGVPSIEELSRFAPRYQYSASPLPVMPELPPVAGPLSYYSGPVSAESPAGGPVAPAAGQPPPATSPAGPYYIDGRWVPIGELATAVEAGLEQSPGGGFNLVAQPVATGGTVIQPVTIPGCLTPTPPYGPWSGEVPIPWDWRAGEAAPAGWSTVPIMGGLCLLHCDSATGFVWRVCPPDHPYVCLQNEFNTVAFCTPSQAPTCEEVCEGDAKVKVCTYPDGTVNKEVLNPDGCKAAPPPEEPDEKCCPPQTINVTVQAPEPKPDPCAPDEEACPEPPAEPPKPKRLEGFDWDDPKVCEEVANNFKAFSDSAKQFTQDVLSPDMVDAGSDLTAIVTSFLNPYPAFVYPILKPVVMQVAAWARQAITSTFRSGQCNDPVLAAPMASKAVLDIIQHWIGVDTRDAKLDYQYTLNVQCPREIPSAAELHGAYLAGTIDYDQWVCLVKANNKLPKLAEAMMYAGRTRPGVLDTVSLYRRGLIDGETYAQKLRELGVLDAADAESYLDLTNVIPPYTDLVRMMVRDSFDEEVVKKFEYDTDFEAKFQGKALEWAAAQGIDQDVMKHIWRAHWRLVSPTQAFQMLHRNRPGRVDDDIVVVKEDVAKLLEIDDLAPWWQDRLISISYGVMRLVDIRKQFNFGHMDKKELEEQLQDRGYNKETAERHAKAMESEKTEWVKGRFVPKQYLAGIATEGELNADLDAYKLEDAERNRLIEDLDYRRRLGTRKKCVAATKKRFMSGEFGRGEAVRLLLGYDLDPAGADEMVKGWECERHSKGREVTATMLCDWVLKGLITRADMYLRLINLGYQDSDAERIARACQVKQQEQKDRAQKQADDAKRRGEKAQQAEREKADRGRKKEEKDSLLEKARKLAKDAQLDDKGEKAKLILLKTARLWKAYSGVDDLDTAERLESILCDLQSRKGYSLVGGTNLVKLIVEASIEAGEKDYMPRALRVMSTLKDGPYEELSCGKT